jgi:hypothetical protein
MPADREQSPVHEPGDDDRTTDEAEAVAGGTEEDELERAHGSGCVGRAEGADPAQREWRRGGRPCTPSGIRGGQGDVKRGGVRVFGKSYGSGTASCRSSVPSDTIHFRSLPTLAIAANEARALVRRHGRGALREISVDPQPQDTQASVGTDPAERAEEVDRANALAPVWTWTAECRRVISPSTTARP